MLSPKLLEILRNWWRVARPKPWLFPGDIPGGHIQREAVELMRQKAQRRCGIAKPITPHSMRHYAEFRTTPSRSGATAPKPIPRKRPTQQPC